MDRDSPLERHRDLLPDTQADKLRVLIGLETREGPEAEGTGWKVTVVEHLRLHVPADAQQAWMEAELQTWDPWLRKQQGFLGREVLWDSERQEGVLLIHWASRADWKAITDQEVAAVQNTFEEAAKTILGLPAHVNNPFPLLSSAEISVT